MGILSYLKDKHFRYLQRYRCEPTLTTSATALTLKDLIPILAVLGAGLAVAIIALAFEMFQRRGADQSENGDKKSVPPKHISSPIVQGLFKYIFLNEHI